MSITRHQVIPRTTCFIFNNRNELLLIEFSSSKGKMAGFFDPPGGHIEMKEGILTNTVREISEETGLTVTNSTLAGVIHVHNFFGKELMLFVTTSTYVSGDLVASYEGIPHWMSLDNLDAVKLFPDLKIILKHMKEYPNRVFTARSEFDDNGNLICFEFE